MVDVVDSETRSRMMSGIRGANTKPEILIRSLLHRRGFRFRLHARNLPGKPDLVLPKYGAVIFVHGCFWHGHDCAYFKWPSTRSEFWRGKILKNQQNDENVHKALTGLGWRVLTVWECATREKGMNPEALVDRIDTWLMGSPGNHEVAGRAAKKPLVC